MPTEKVVQLRSLATRAAVAPKSINADDRTVDVIWSTGAGVERFDYATGERYLEILSMDPAHVRLDRLNQAGPVLDGHMGWSVRSMLGSVVEGSAKIQAKQGRATLQFSRRPEVDGVWRDLEDGIVRSTSVGYDVHAYEETPAKGDRIAIRKAIDWEPYEVSMVPMPADLGAMARDGEPAKTHPCRIITRGDEPAVTHEVTMSDPNRQASEYIVEPPPAAAPPAPAPAERAGEPNERDRGAAQERARVQGILVAVRAARLPQAFSDRLIADATMNLERAQTAVFEEMGRREPEAAPTQSAVVVQMGEDPLVHTRAGIEEAILHRVAPQSFKLTEKGREYRGMTMLDVARVYLQARGIRTTGFGKMEIAGLALGLSHRFGPGLHTTSDFALLLADVANKTLRRAYEDAPQTFLAISRRVTLPDFKPVNRLQLGEAPDLLEVDEHGEFTRGTVGEGKEAFQLTTYGRVFGITRKALVNDDTDAFSRIPMLFGRAARKLESNIVWQQITSNPTMGDGNALFSAAHGNLQTDGDVISIPSLSRARKAIRLQTGVDGTTMLDLVPRFLIVPAELETIADQYTALITQTAQASAVNPFSGRLTVITEPRLDDNSTTAWYMAASPDQIDIVEHGYLEGEEGPMVESRVGFDVDGLEIKARLDFAAKVIDWRGLHKDPGEAVS